MSRQPLYFEPESFEKVAGYKLPANPKLWQSEIIRYLKSQHPYLPLETAEIDLRRLDASKGAAVGSVILEGEMAVPVVISRPRPGADPELAPLDVFFHKGRYRYLDPETVRSVTHSPAVGEAEGGGASRAIGGNPYVGDVTGDATPLEYSGQASPFAGPYDGTKTSSLKSSLVSRLRALPDTGKSAIVGAAFRTPTRVSQAVEKETGARAADPRRSRAKTIAAVGKGALIGAAEGATVGALVGKTKDVLYKKSSYDVDNGFTARLLKTGSFDPNDLASVRKMLATNPALLKGTGNNLAVIDMVTRVQPETRSSVAVRKPNIVQIFEAPSGINIKFSGGPSQRVTDDELRSILGDRYPEVMRKLRSGDVYVESDGVERASWDPDSGSGALPVASDGAHMIYTRRGDTVAGYVCRQMVTIDGQVVPKKLFVALDGRYSVATELFGTRVSTSPRLPSRPPKTGQHGVFVSYVHGTPIPTTPMTISGVRLVTDSGGHIHTLFIVRDSVSGQSVTLVPVAGVQGFQQMTTVNNEISALSDGVVYYAPGDVEWVPLTSKLEVAEASDQLTKLSSDRSSTHVTSDGALWTVKSAFLGGLARTGFNQVKTLATNPGQIGRGAKKLYNAAGGGFGGAARVAKHYAPGAAMIAAPMAAGAVAGSMLGGQNKNASWQDLSEWDARELLVAMGMDGDGAAWALDEAKRRQGLDRGVKIAGLHEPQRQGFEVIVIPDPEYDQATVNFAAACRPSEALFKAAAASSVPETLDAVLSLEFITPQNLKYFVDSIEDFDETASRVAAMLVAVRLGMPHVPEEPVRQALEGLSKTVNRLRVLKSALDHRAEQAATA
jgi:hypothetical protein